MQNKPSFTQNNYGVKSSSDMYRNIKGVHYIHHTSNPADFAQAKEEAKKKGIRTKIIKDELFMEKMPKNPAAVALGSIKSEKKSKSSRANGKKGGRPKRIIQ